MQPILIIDDDRAVTEALAGALDRVVVFRFPRGERP